MEDLISELPDDLLHKILLNFTTREAVTTSVLSTRWRYLWQSMPGLIFDGYERHVTDFVDIFLNVNKESQIYEFTLRHFAAVIPGWKLFMDQAFTRRGGIKALKIDASTYYEESGLGRIELPVSFYTCESLVSLDLTFVKLDDDFNDGSIINLPHLEVMKLKHVRIPSLEMLISCSPVLQKLMLYDIGVQPVKVRSHTLRRLILTSMISTWRPGVKEVVIDTPNLDFLVINATPLEYFRINSVGSSIQICIDVRFVDDGNDDFSNLHKFFGGISSGVTSLNISPRTLSRIYYIYSKMEHQQQQLLLLPEFKNLTRLSASFFHSLSDMLPLYLSSFPNLKSIDLDLRGHPKMEEIANCPVPQCLLTSIENVNVKFVSITPKKPEIEFAKYILENATALKKLTIGLFEEEDVRSSVLEQILTFPTTSPFVEVKIYRAFWRMLHDQLPYLSQL